MIWICGAELPDSLEDLLEMGVKKEKKAGERRACRGDSDGSNEEGPPGLKLR